ncbi:GNAT family N-acetyltransferase [Streptomyces roseirectus]|uniref:GNAT family N-acetyltransferase n=1 Tax=Streptomyces roseirectus TaxID=2768066 RepID=UPI001FEB8391|nr:GNAT family N-acetyltransferase [Streptomyces roseirectus]
MIREAHLSDAETITTLHRRARATYYPDGLPDDGTDWLAAWRTAIGNPDGRVLCALAGERIVGIASFRPPGVAQTLVKLFQFHIDPDHWRTGLGTVLHAACVQHWRADGRETAVLDVHVDNRRAQAFYARQGWTPDPENPPEPGDHHLFLRYAVPSA